MNKRATTKITAHRGAIENHPENTLAAFLSAVEAGADRIELDVHESKDHRLIVHHDYVINHSSLGTLLIPETDFEVIQSVNSKIPFLEDIVQKIGNKVSYEIELRGITKSFIESVLSLAKKYDLLNTIEFTSPHPYVLSYIKQRYPQITVGMFVKPIPEWMNPELGKKLIIENAKLGNIDILHLPIELVTQAFVEMIHNNHLLAHAANCDTEEDLKKALDARVDQLSTNCLSKALVLKK